MCVCVCASACVRIEISHQIPECMYQNSTTRSHTAQPTATPCTYPGCVYEHRTSATQCTTVQPTATQYITLQPTTTPLRVTTSNHCNAVHCKHAENYCTSLQLTALYSNTSYPGCVQQHQKRAWVALHNQLQPTATNSNTLHVPRVRATASKMARVALCNQMHHTATHCNTLHVPGVRATASKMASVALQSLMVCPKLLRSR